MADEDPTPPVPSIKKPKRKAISDSVRFEVFKRDSFKCQYCGRSAPEIVLRVDHIKPVAKGGEADILNLITACFECNAGKGARELDDHSLIQKQRDQLEELNERRVQLEMLLAWKQGLQDIKTREFDILRERIVSKAPNWAPNEVGAQRMRKWIREHGLSDLLDAVDASADQYLERNQKGNVTDESWGVFFAKIPRIVAFRAALREEPFLRDLVSIRAFLKSRIYTNWRFERDCLPLMKKAHLTGTSIAEIRDLARGVTSWGEFEDALFSWIEDSSGNKPDGGTTA